MDETESKEKLPGRKSGKNLRTGAILLAIVAGMFVFAYANAEFFVMICERAGILATRPTEASDSGEQGPLGRELEIYFTAMVNDGLPISFSMVNRTQKTRINAWQMNDYRFTNISNKTVYFKPVHDIYPNSAGASEVLELRKCFCFDQQKIGPGESYTMPVEYRFTDELEDGVSVLKMSYTLFPSTKKDYEASLVESEGTP